MASSKISLPDENISEFYFRPELTIDPPLPDAKAKSASNDFIKLRQIKDEDVIFDPVEGIKVISNNVTGVEGKVSPNDYQYNYATFKSGLGALVKVATDAGSTVKGQVIIRDATTQNFYRLIVDGTKIKVEEALLGWPDGTNSPFPTGGGA